MSYKRYMLDLAFLMPLEPPLQGELTAFEATIRTVLRNSATKINEGLPNEEDTTKATWHECNHDSGNKVSCGQEVEI